MVLFEQSLYRRYHENFHNLIAYKYYIGNFYIHPRSLYHKEVEPRPEKYEETYTDKLSDECMLEILGNKSKGLPCLTLTVHRATSRVRYAASRSLT